jgi:starch synthase
LKHVDAFTAISPAVAEIYTRHKIDNNKIFIAPAGIDHKYLSNLKNNFSCQPQIAGNPYTILYVGRLSQEKGVDLLINAIRKLEFQVKVHIVGDGPKIDDLKKLSYELGLSECIVFHGWLPYDKVIDVYSGSQLFIHPARWPEPLGRTILDAMAIGVPVIAADSGGPPWALSGTGLTFVPGDTDDLVKKINTVYRNTSLAVNLAVRAQERAKYFDYNKTIPELLDVYNGVIEKAMTKKT